MITPGVCQFCKVTEDQVDGHKLSWFNGARNCCTKYDCKKKYHAQIREARREFQAKTRKRTPAEVHEAIKAERRARNKRYREAAKARGLLREKDGAA